MSLVRRETLRIPDTLESINNDGIAGLLRAMLAMSDIWVEGQPRLDEAASRETEGGGAKLPPCIG